MSQLRPASAPEPAGIVRGRLGGAEEPAGVALEHPEVGEQVVAQVDGLRPLQVRVAGRRPVAVRLGLRHQRLHQALEQRDRARGVGADEQGQVGGHLVVARAGRVELAAERADQLGQPPLDRHVDVLVVLAELEGALLELPADPVEPLGDLLAAPRRRARRACAARERAPSTARCRMTPGASRTRSRS